MDPRVPPIENSSKPSVQPPQGLPLPPATSLKAAAMAQQVFDSAQTSNGQELSIEEQLERLTLAKREKDKIAVIQAISQGREAVVALLCANKVDPSADNNALLDWACGHGEDAILFTLIADKRVNPQSGCNWYRVCNWASAKGPDAVKLLLSNPYVDPAIDNRLIDWACLEGHADIAALLLTNPKVPLKGDFLLSQCCRTGHSAVVALLLTRCQPTPKDLFLASGNGHDEIVRMLLVDGRVDPGAEEDQAIGYVGNEAVANLLLANPRVHPEAKNSRSILMASIHGKVDVVRALLRDGRPDPTVDMCACLVWAHSNQHDAVVVELMNDKRVNPHRHTDYDSWFRDPRRLSQICAVSDYIQVSVPDRPVT